VGITPKGAGTTYGKRLREYQRRSATILWVGAGLAALIGLVTSSLAEGAPKVLGAVAATLIFLGGGAFAIARIKFEWAATVLERKITDADAKREQGDTATHADAELSNADKTWPKVGEIAYVVEILIVPAAAIVYLVSVWWAVYG
jgi:hypothetical protein